MTHLTCSTESSASCSVARAVVWRAPSRAPLASGSRSAAFDWPASTQTHCHRNKNTPCKVGQGTGGGGCDAVAVLPSGKAARFYFYFDECYCIYC